MDLFPWKDDYSIGVDEIDDQHKKLLSILNHLASEMSKGQGKKVLGKSLNELVDYTVYHFETEEKYFDQINYPDADKHKKEHQILVEDVLKFKTEFESNRIGLTIELMHYLKNWVINHINDTDKGFGKCLSESGPAK